AKIKLCSHNKSDNIYQIDKYPGPAGVTEIDVCEDSYLFWSWYIYY
ncbi:unnamed protein product, partial [Staurois parvus]